MNTQCMVVCRLLEWEGFHLKRAQLCGGSQASIIGEGAKNGSTGICSSTIQW